MISIVIIYNNSINNLHMYIIEHCTVYNLLYILYYIRLIILY